MDARIRSLMPFPRKIAEMHALQHRISRRRLLQTATLAVASLALTACQSDDADPSPTSEPEPTATPVLVETVAGYDDPTRWEGHTLSVTSWGGEYQDAQTRALFEPFERLTGAKVDVSLTDLDALRADVEAGEVSIDVCDVLAEDVLPLANLGVIGDIDYDAIDTTDLLPEAVREHGLASSFHSTVLACRADLWEGGVLPSGWADFWDVERFPGTRGLHRDPQGTLEFALIADGVALEDLYPLDVDRAFASLDKLRESILLWWEQGAQPTQMITSGDIDMVSVWNSRIERIHSEGAAVTIQWNGGAISGDAWVIPNGAPNPELALDFLNFASRPETGAAFSSLVPFGPVNSRSFDLLPAELRASLPTSPELRPKQFVINYDWWFANREDVGIRFEEWLSEST